MLTPSSVGLLSTICFLAPCPSGGHPLGLQPLALGRAGAVSGLSRSCAVEPNLFLDVHTSWFSYLAAGIHSSPGTLSRGAWSASSLHQLCSKVGQQGGGSSRCPRQASHAILRCYLPWSLTTVATCLLF